MDLGGRFLIKWRNLVALLAVARLLGRFSYGVDEVACLDVNSVTPQLVDEIWQLVQSIRRKGREPQQPSVAHEACIAAAPPRQ